MLGRRLVEAREQGRARILVMGAHVLRAGVARFLIDLMERGLITHVAMNGAGPVHDWEFALIGATTESVARYIQTAGVRVVELARCWIPYRSVATWYLWRSMEPVPVDY